MFSIYNFFEKDKHQLYNFDLSNHFADDLLIIEMFNPLKTLSVVYWYNEQQFYYVKRFQIDEEIPINKSQNFIGENPENKLISITWVHYPRLEIEFGGKNSDRENEIIEVAEFIGIKSFKAKGKRLTNYQVDNIKEIEPVVKDETDQKPTLVYESSEDEKTKPFDDIPFETLSKREKWYMQADVVLNFDHDLEIEEIVKVLE